MVSSLQSIVLYSVPIAILFDMLKMLHHLPMGKECQRALFKRCTHKELRAWAKTLPWDHPIVIYISGSLIPPLAECVITVNG